MIAFEWNATLKADHVPRTVVIATITTAAVSIRHPMSSSASKAFNCFQ
jgi:hypothetical protein